MRIRHDATLYMTPACGNWPAAGHMPAMTSHPHITQTHTTPTQRHSRAVAQKLSSSRRMPRSLISSALSHPPLPTPPPCHQETPDWLSLEQSPPPVCCRGNCSTRTSSSHRVSRPPVLCSNMTPVLCGWVCSQRVRWSRRISSHRVSRPCCSNMTPVLCGWVCSQRVRECRGTQRGCW